MAFEKDIEMFKHAPWGGDTTLGDIVVLGRDWSGAAFNWGFGDPAAPATGFRLENASAGSEGVSATYDDEYVHPQTGAIVGATIISPQVESATLEALTYSDDDDLLLPHTLYIDPTDQIERVYCYGTVTIKQGVPQA